jgi:transketolase
MTTIILASKIRESALSMVHKASASHIGSALSICDIVAVLYGSIMKVDPNNPKLEGRDRFILSKGHACVAVYAALYHKGFLTLDELDSYGADESWLMNHISHKVSGVEFSTGALGHGLSFGVGKALAGKKQNSNWRTFVVLSDGEMDEGSNWEALMFASHHNLKNLTAIIDYNKLQSLDTVAATLNLEPLCEKIRAFGAHVIEVDGHDHAALNNALSIQSGYKPIVIIAHTVKGKGVSFMENRVEWHYKSPNAEEMSIALREINKSNA